jgi:excisionase family DNA binding protein
MREVMTPEQVAEYLQLSADYVYRLIRTHQLAAAKIGRAYRIPKEDVEAFLLARSSRPRVREALFDRVMAFAEKTNPGLSSDDVLEELEATDAEEKRARAKGG